MVAFDYEMERERLKRRRAVSDAMLAQSMQPMGGTEFASGIAVRRSPLEGIAKLAQSYFATQQGKKLDEEQAALGQRKEADMASAVEDYYKATTARDATPDHAPEVRFDDEGNAAPFIPGSPAYTPTQADRGAAVMKLAGRTGGMESVAKALAAAEFKPKEIKAYKPGDVLYQDGKQVGAIPKEKDPFTLAPGARRYNPDGSEMVAAPNAPAAPTELSRLQSERAALPDGDPRAAQYDAAIRKATSHQPAASANVTVNTEKQFLGEIGQKLGGEIATGVSNAKAAVGTLNTVNQIREALDSGQVVAGPGATPQMVLMQIGQRLNPGADPSETLLKTRQAIQGLAQLELDAAAQMKGQGQITEAERGIIRRAASGDIDGMTTSELRVLTNTLDRTARYKIRSNAQNVQRLRGNPSASSMVEFMNVDEPPVYVPPSSAGKGATGGLTETERRELEDLRRKLKR